MRRVQVMSSELDEGDVLVVVESESSMVELGKSSGNDVWGTPERRQQLTTFTRALYEPQQQ